jgi:hypothetical protein
MRIMKILEGWKVLEKLKTELKIYDKRASLTFVWFLNECIV